MFRIGNYVGTYAGNGIVVDVLIDGIYVVMVDGAEVVTSDIWPA